MKRLKELRIQQGLSQKDFAKIFHASQNTISQWENGTRKPSYETTQKVADYFGVSVDYLLGRDIDIDEEIRKDKERTGYVMGFGGKGKKIIEVSEEEMDAVDALLAALRRKDRNK